MPEFQSSPEPVADQDVHCLTEFQCDLNECGRNAAWVRLGGELDLAAAARFERCLGRALDGARLVVVDLRQLTFIDSSAVHLIVDARSRALQTERRLVVVRGSSQPTRLLELTGLSDRLEIVDLDPVAVRELATPVQSRVAAPRRTVGRRSTDQRQAHFGPEAQGELQSDRTMPAEDARLVQGARRT
jgi:anti-sigma B factor antagonist